MSTIRDNEEGAATKAARIADALRETIARGDLEDGARLYQDRLAEQFETSITPVREALKVLQTEGLLVAEPHRGVRVARPNLDQIASIYIMRRLVEPYAAKRSARRLSRLDLDWARQINERFGEAGGDAEEARDLNRKFHFTFYNACGLPTLAAEIEHLWSSFPWAALQVKRGHAEDSYQEHLQILTAIEAADEREIGTIFETHIRHGFEALVQHIGATLVTDPFEDARESDFETKDSGWWKP
jgi:DNA-binding GntR family transcriptional regulator